MLEKMVDQLQNGSKKKVTIIEPFSLEVHFGTAEFGRNPSIF